MVSKGNHPQMALIQVSENFIIYPDRTDLSWPTLLDPKETTAKCGRSSCPCSENFDGLRQKIAQTWHHHLKRNPIPNPSKNPPGLQDKSSMSHVFPSVFPIFSPCFCPIHSARGGPATSRKLRISKPLGPRRFLGSSQEGQLVELMSFSGHLNGCFLCFFMFLWLFTFFNHMGMGQYL